MTPEERSLLERTHQLVEENNEILRSMKRRARLGTAIRVFYWAVIIGISFGAFYFIQPYLDFVRGVVSGENATSTQSNDNRDLLDLLK